MCSRLNMFLSWGARLQKKHKTALNKSRSPKLVSNDDINKLVLGHTWHHALRFYPYKCRKKKQICLNGLQGFSKQQLPPSNLQHQTLQTGIVSKEFHTSKSIAPPRSMNQWFVQLLGPFPKKPKTFTTILLGSGWFQPIWKILVKLDHVTK